MLCHVVEIIMLFTISFNTERGQHFVHYMHTSITESYLSFSIAASYSKVTESFSSELFAYLLLPDTWYLLNKYIFERRKAGRQEEVVFRVRSEEMESKHSILPCSLLP